MLYAKGDKIGQYAVKFPHKQGAYAETYRVKDNVGKTRFLKLINLNKLSRHQVDNEGNIIEVEVSKALCHPNLCDFIDEGDIFVGGTPYKWFVTEYVSGETLDQRVIRDGTLSVYEIKQVGKALLSALSFLHSLPTPIVHGEVTIQNTLVNLTGNLSELKLIDFGHARFLNQPPAKPNLEQLNPFYLAPERFTGVSQPQSDLYSVGVILYYLLYEKLPWFIETSRLKNVDVVDAILAERNKELNLPPIEKYELDQQLVNTIVKALSYDVEDRFSTAEDFMKALEGEVVIERQSTRKKIHSSPDHRTSTNKSDTMIPNGPGFAAVAGMEELKQQLRDEVIEPLHNPEEYQRYGVTIPNGMLLYGPPGCGKTFFAKHFAEEVGFNFMLVTPATLKSRWVNATQENIAKMFKEAEEKAPTIIFIDEINELVPNRESDVHEMSRSAVNEMLAQMDRTGEKGIFIIGATNYPHMIDPAILRSGRLDKKYYVGVPDTPARIALFRLYLEKRPYDFGLDYEELARLTENYVSSDIQMIINDASRQALRLKSKITFQLLKDAILATKPSLSSDELKRYESIRAKMNGEITTINPRPRIGFK